MAEEDTELVPLDGEDEGLGNFFGSICSQNSLGSLTASTSNSDNKMSAIRRERTRNLCLHGPGIFPVFCLQTVLGFDQSVPHGLKELAGPCGHPFILGKAIGSETCLSIMRRADSCDCSRKCVSVADSGMFD